MDVFPKFKRFMMQSGEFTLKCRFPSRGLHFSVGLSVISKLIPESGLQLYWIE